MTEYDEAIKRLRKTQEGFTFRFDDVCINSLMYNTIGILDIIRLKYPSCRIIFAISPLVSANEGERVFPKIWNAYSDYRKFYTVDTIGLPDCTVYNVDMASHGLVHCDHRLMHRSAQELSILASCSMLKSKLFVPPFNKWNSDTEEICKENGIELIKFEDGWKCAEYNEFNPDHKLWYLHAREFTIEQFEQWINQK